MNDVLDGLDNIEDSKYFEKRSRDIAGCGDYSLAVSRLSEEGLLYDQVVRIQNIVGDDIEFLTDKDWELLTILELFDQITFEHCLKTYEIAKKKVEKVLDGGVVIADLINEEKISLEQFYRACLLHDIGKIEVPKQILNEVLSKDWNRPICDILGENDLSDIESKGFDINDSSKKIIEYHEIASERILKEAGFYKEAILAGQHHNYKNKSLDELHMPLTASALCISLNLADLVHLADVQQALEQKRPYKGEMRSKVDIINILIQHAEDGRVDKYITYLWIKDEMDEITEEERNSDEFKDKLSRIQNFVDSYN